MRYVLGIMSYTDLELVWPREIDSHIRFSSIVLKSVMASVGPHCLNPIAFMHTRENGVKTGLKKKQRSKASILLMSLGVRINGWFSWIYYLAERKIVVTTRSVALRVTSVLRPLCVPSLVFSICRLFHYYKPYFAGWFVDIITSKREVLGRTNRPLSFDTTRTA
jgi:hypothetical protein